MVNLPLPSMLGCTYLNGLPPKAMQLPLPGALDKLISTAVCYVQESASEGVSPATAPCNTVTLLLVWWTVCMLSAACLGMLLQVQLIFCLGMATEHQTEGRVACEVHCYLNQRCVTFCEPELTESQSEIEICERRGWGWLKCRGLAIIFNGVVSR